MANMEFNSLNASQSSRNRIKQILKALFFFWKDIRFDDTILLLDIDECSNNMNKCNPLSTDCQNFRGGYKCKCKDGYKPIGGDKFKCESKYTM